MARLNQFLLVCAVSVSACVTTPVTDRRQMILVSNDQMNQLGAQGYEEILKESKLIEDPTVVAPLAAIAGDIEKASEAKMDWAFSLIQDKQANAFCLPGGKIGVYTGILPIAQTNAGLAAILGHEVAHATAHHGAERVSQAMLAETVMKGVDVALGDVKNRGLILAALGVGANLGILMPFSRTHESEADRIGLIYMARAGYDPREAVKLWERMAERGDVPPEFLSTHPNPGTRIKALQKHMPEALAIYEKSQQKKTMPLPALSH